MITTFFQSLGVLATLVLHPFFISMTDVNYNIKNTSLEVSVRIFTDDFEKTLKKNCNCKVDIINPADKKAVEKLAETYILKHLQIKLDGQVRQLEFAGYQQEEESTWNYFQVKNVSPFKKIEITNTLLYDYKSEQINMVHVKANEKELSDKLDYPQKSFVMTF